ncbi:hypothetical protein M413DRAFT_22107 [Hebeloma cylindrosporum]|uniref:Uncharacterized protein n=1 Tax=Hebeloma cylindrosporum TaxID=76867 RepID=A0A0C3CFB1_HEBCY|nr:hypothetical protein M413DRAFT_22107 [Hebeloma cylindrosporum h7]
MAENIIVPHPPAVKVGGRRLSVSKHKAPTADTHHASSAHKTTAKSDEDDADAAARAPQRAAAADRPDYPRPAPPGAPPTANVNAEDAPPPPHQHQHQHQHEDDAPPKKDRNEKKLHELPHWKLESTRPTRDNIHGGKGHAMGIRIAQPAGKALGV